MASEKDYSFAMVLTWILLKINVNNWKFEEIVGYQESSGN